MTFNKRIFSISILSILGLAMAGGVIYGLVYVFNFNKYPKQNITYQTLAEKEAFIRERTFSLKFTTREYMDPIGRPAKSSLYGTSWIFKKALNKEVYYLATNIHVISSAVSLETNQTNKYQIADYIESVELGYPNDPKVTSSVDDLSLELFDTRVEFPKIVYTSSYVENAATYPIPAIISTNPSFYTYAMSDLAILEFDFSTTTNKFKEFLKYYDLNPTKFFSTPLGNYNYYQQNYFIGGYPFLNPDPINKPAKIGTWGFDSSANEKVATTTGTIISNFPIQPPPTPLSGILLPDNVVNPSTNDEARHFQNISNQITITNIDLTGGSSGSMVINDNNEIVGIYWGAYMSRDGTEVRGAFDILYTDAYTSIFSNMHGSVYKAYNRVEEANLIIDAVPPIQI